MLYASIFSGLVEKNTVYDCFPDYFIDFCSGRHRNILDTSRAGWADLSTLPPDFGTSTSGVTAQKSASGKTSLCPGQRPLQEI